MKKILFRTSLVVLLAASVSYAQRVSSTVTDASSALGAHQRGAPPNYTITDLGRVGGPPGQPFMIRNNGLIAGAAAASGTTWHAVLWYQGMKFDIGIPGLGGPNSASFGVNDWGQAVGEAESGGPDPYGEDFCGFGTNRICQPFLWEYGLTTRLAPLKDKNGVAGTNASAEANNNQGQVVGTAENTTRDSTCPPLNRALGQSQIFQFKPVMWENGAVQELPTVSGDPDGIAFAINDRGQAVGASGSCTAFQATGDLTYLYGLHATMWHNGTVTDLGNLGGIASGGGNTAIGINNRSQAVGISGTADGLFHGFLWSWETGIQDLGTVGDDIASVALGINDGGDVVGISFDADFNPRAFLRPAGGTLVDLNSIAPTDSNLFLFDACSINSHGEIIGIAMDGLADLHGYLATPANGAVNSSASSGAAASSVRFESARQLLRQRLAAAPLGVRSFLPR